MNKEVKAISPISGSSTNYECQDDILTVLYNDYMKEKKLVKNKYPLIVKTFSEDELFNEDFDEEPVIFNPNDSIIFVTFKLPLEIRLLNSEEKDIDKKWEIQLLPDTHWNILDKLQKQKLKNMKWLGWVGINVSTELQAEIVQILKKYNFIPIFLEQDLVKKFSDEYCNEFLNSIFCNQFNLKSKIKQEDYIEIFENVNKIFAKNIMNEIESHSLILINDYNLILTPKFISIKNPKQSISFTFNTPFPSYEIFKIVYDNENFLRSLLCADLISFKSSEHLKTFFSVCGKFFDLNHEFQKGGYMYLRYYGRKIFVRVSIPLIEPLFIDNLVQKSEYQEILVNYMTQNNFRQLILCLIQFNRMECIESIINVAKKLFGERSAIKYRLLFIEINDGYVSSKNNFEKSEYKKEILTFIKRINDELINVGIESSIELIEENLSAEKKLALMQISETLCCFGTSNELELNVLEYIYLLRKSTGTLLLSEFSNSMKNLNAFVKVNPFNEKNIYEKLHKCLDTDKDIQNYLLDNDRKLISKYTAWNSLQNILLDLKRIKNIKSINCNLSISNDNNFKIVAVNPKFRLFPKQLAKEAFIRAKNKIIILSYEGTLIHDRKDVNQNSLSPRNMKITLSKIEIDALKKLCNMPNVEVYIVSSKSFDNFERVFNDISHIGLLGENGFYYKLRKESKLQHLYPFDLSWKSTVQKIMQNYANRTDGACLDIKESSIGWNYENVGNDISKLQIKELINHLTLILEHTESVEILR